VAEVAEPGAPPDPIALLKSKEYVKLLLLAGIVGIPISALAFFFLKLVAELQKLMFTDLPTDVLGFDSTPAWWPIPIVAVGGLLAALSITYLRGTGGHSPADGFKPGGVTPPAELPGIFAASLSTLAFGAVLGPEAPLILIGSGLGALAVRLAAKDAPDRARAVIAAAGSFAAISALLGSPLIGAFLLMEASGIGGPVMGLVLLPGLLAAGLGTLVFVGLDNLTGYGTFSLSLPNLPHVGSPTIGEFGYAIAIGLAAPLLGGAIRRLALAIRPRIEPRMVLLMPLLGLLIGGLAVVFDQATDKSYEEVLFSGQDQLPGLVGQASAYSVGALLLLIACKGLAYALSLSSFRGGPVFPAIFLGAAGGIAASHLPGLSLVPAIAMGIGAMSCTMLGLPLTSVLLATLLVSNDSLNVIPLVIVAVVVSHVLTARLAPAPAAEPAAEPSPAAPAPTPAVAR
jgi:H+/Cl- antiporter ClcA